MFRLWKVKIGLKKSIINFFVKVLNEATCAESYEIILFQGNFGTLLLKNTDIFLKRYRLIFMLMLHGFIYAVFVVS